MRDYGQRGTQTDARNAQHQIEPVGEIGLTASHRVDVAQFQVARRFLTPGFRLGHAEQRWLRDVLDARLPAYGVVLELLRRRPARRPAAPDTTATAGDADHPCLSFVRAEKL